ncbi:helix-turn-helix domain-containing protein [Corynebacterium stationis]|uniref:helix-turn-helix domain-containing protein n=1 Tax=Corynebacterium stationis TaxID=1705 RepID=UPI0026F0867B|nr:helix-turn-helix transcriptional regulator [Corynebacterium stationis]
MLTNLVINTCELLTPPTRSAREIAELVHTSPRTIERASVTETGETFQERRRQACTTKAKQLIIDGLPMDSIALHVGYSTASAFGRAFKKRTGLSPCANFKEYVSAGVRI